MRILAFFILMSLMTLPIHAKEQRLGWGLSLGEGTSSLRIGGRLQGIAGYDAGNSAMDMYLRRARVNLQYQVKNDHMIYIELRNDNQNREDSGERRLFIGDAYYEIPIEHRWISDITLFRSKVDVSYSQTSSSKNLINPNRARPSDYAANFVVQNRRANNIQLNGGGKRSTFQLVVSDGVQSEEVETVFSQVGISSIAEQSLTYGGKFRLFLWGDKVTLQETFYEKQETLSLGLGFFQNPSMTFNLSSGASIETSRELYNLELSFARGAFRFLAEGFMFAGDIIDPSSLRVGTSRGTYVRTEYLFGKWSPYLGYSLFNRDKDNRDTNEESFLVGLNYYSQKSSRRYGLSYENKQYDRQLRDNDAQEVMFYIMLDY